MSAALGICLALAAAGPPAAADVVFVAADRFTLVWMHSIERVRWEEDYRVQAAASNAPPLLLRKNSKTAKFGATTCPKARLKHFRQ